MKNWPSEPMFQIFMRRAMCTARAFIRIGVSSSTISSKPWRSPNVPSIAFPSRLSGIAARERRGPRRPSTSATDARRRHAPARPGRASRSAAARGASDRQPSSRRPVSAAWPPMSRPSRSRSASRRSNSPTIRPSYITAMRSLISSTSSRSSEISRTAQPASRGRPAARPARPGRRCTSRPRDGCTATNADVATQRLAVDDQPLLVAARQDARDRQRATGCARVACSTSRRANSPAADRRSTHPSRQLPACGSGAGRRCRARAPTARVPCGCGPRGCCRRRPRRTRAARRVGESLAGDDDLAGVDPAQPGEHLGQLGLAVARHAGDAEDLARAHVEGRRRAAPAGPARCGR